MYFSCKIVEAAIVRLWLLLRKQLRKNPSVALVFEVGCLLLTGSDLCSEGEMWSGNDCNPPKRVSPRAACPKFQQHIRVSVWSATLWTRLLPWAPLFPTALEKEHSGPTVVDTRMGDSTSGFQTPLSPASPACPCPPWGNGAGGGVGISLPKSSRCYERPFLPVVSTHQNMKCHHHIWAG